MLECGRGRGVMSTEATKEILNSLLFNSCFLEDYSFSG